MKGRKGFALITVLWVVLALSVLVTIGVGHTRVAMRAAEYRLASRRAYWAARACLALLRAQVAAGDTTLRGTPVAVGDGSWCHLEEEDAFARINPNLVDAVTLSRLLGPDVAAHVSDWIDADDDARLGGSESEWYRSEGRPAPRNGPIASVEELTLVRGMEDADPDALRRFFTTEGDGRVDPNRAPAEVTEALSELPEGAARSAVRLVEAGRSLDDAEEFMLASGTRLGADGFRALTQRTVFSSRDHVTRIVAGARAGEPIVELMVSWVQVNERAVVRAMGLIR